MEESLKQDIHKAINDSGFTLENYVDVILRKHGWQTITNRHYIDDIKGVERELDILAYKVYLDKKENIEYITSLVISCKKSSVNKWCFLTRDANPNDVNTDWTPYHYCTNDKVLSYMTKNHRDVIIKKYLSHRAIKHLYNFDERVFAYQVLTENVTKKGKNEERHWVITKNEPLHDSIITSIKALDMEKRSRIEQHVGRPYNRYYTFHILSIFDGDMIKSHLDDEGNVKSEDITNINYLNRHIVNKVDDFYIVNFIKKDIFDYRLRLFDYLHDENVRTLPKLTTAFYENVFEDREKVNILWEKCALEIGEALQIYIKPNGGVSLTSIPDISYFYNGEKLGIYIEGDLYDNDTLLEEINNNDKLIAEVRDILKSYYRYSGTFVFSNGFRLF